MSDPVEPDAHAAAPDKAAGAQFPLPVFRPEGPPVEHPAPPAPTGAPATGEDGGYWTAPSSAAQSTQVTSAVGMPAFMSPLGAANLVPPRRPPAARRTLTILALLVVVAGATVFGILEFPRSTSHHTTLPTTVGGHPINPSVTSSRAKNSVEVLVAQPVTVADFLNSASYGYYGYGVAPDLLVAAGPTSAISDQERTVLTQPPAANAVVYPPAGTSGVEVWCAPADPGQKVAGYQCLWSDDITTCLLYDFDAKANIEAYNVALELRSALK